MNYIIELAEFLSKHECTMSGPELADHLNRNKFPTEYGSEYSGERGIYNVLSAIYTKIEASNPSAAKCIALSFVGKDGSHAWKK
jgi:hypothetical protein